MASRKRQKASKARMSGHSSRSAGAGLKSAPPKRGRRKRMGLGGFFVSVAVALGIAGAALAQQPPQPKPARPAPQYRQQFLVPGSSFHGVHGIAFNKDDQLFAGSVI